MSLENMFRIGGLMLRQKLVCAVAILAVHSSMALAATLQPTAGSVLVNRGDGFKSAGVGPSQLLPGDMVMASGGGSAQIIYPDGSKVSVEPGSVVTVAGQVAPNAGNGPQETSPNVGNEASSTGNAAPGGAIAGATTISPFAIAAGAVVVGVGVVVLSKKSSASP